MNFMTTGSIYSYTQTLKLTQKWNIKKSNGNYFQKTASVQADRVDSAVCSEFEQLQKQLEQLQDQSKPDLMTLHSKLSSGKKLSAEELAYLREHDPISYQKAKQMEAERENYKRELKQCKTKEEVERLRTNRIAGCFAVAISISHNAAIPKLTKMSLMAAECAKVQAIDEETRAFKASLPYAHMPTDAEKNEEDKKRLEALQGESEEAQTKKAQKDTPDHLTEASKHPVPKLETPEASENQAKADESSITIRQGFDFPKAVTPYHTAYGREIYKQEAKTSVFLSQKRQKKT